MQSWKESKIKLIKGWGRKWQTGPHVESNTRWLYCGSKSRHERSDMGAIRGKRQIQMHKLGPDGGRIDIECTQLVLFKIKEGRVKSQWSCWDLRTSNLSFLPLRGLGTQTFTSTRTSLTASSGGSLCLSWESPGREVSLQASDMINCW